MSEIISGYTPTELKGQQQRAKKMLLSLAIFSIVMLFAGLTSAYIMLMNGEYWVKIATPNAFYISTALILISSLTIKMAVDASKRDNKPKVQMMVLLTLLLGIGFAISQYMGWQELMERGNYVSSRVENVTGEYGTDFSIFYKGQELLLQDGKYYSPDDSFKDQPLNDKIMDKSNTASSFIYVLSGLHLAHLVGGFLYLIFLLIKAYRVGIDSQNNLSLKQGSTYWHFLDILWLYLFLFLLFIH